jgi:hypothetical protein
MKRRTLSSFVVTLLLAFCLAGVASAEDIVVVVSPDSGVDRLTRSEVTNIFLGRYKKLPSGLTAVPVDTMPLKEQFYARLVNKPLNEINAYWARLVFSGATTPPIAASTDQAALQAVTEHAAGYIAYVERSKASKQLRIVFSLEAP